MDTHLSMVSNRLNVVMKQLAVIATIFLPLGFLTGFFGQNFAWPLAHLATMKEFLFLGIGSEIVGSWCCSCCSASAAGSAAARPPERPGPRRRSYCSSV